MGYCKPLYGTEDVMERMENIAKLDEKINVLMIEREKEYETLKEEVKKLNTVKD